MHSLDQYCAQPCRDCHRGSWSGPGSGGETGASKEAKEEISGAYSDHLAQGPIDFVNRSPPKLNSGSKTTPTSSDLCGSRSVTASGV